MLRAVLLLLVPAAFAAGGAWMWLQGGRYEETENAYVKANLIVVTPEVEGPAVEVAVREHQRVKAGELLFRVDAARYEAAVARAEAELALARTELASLRAEHRVALAEAAEAEERTGFLSRQLERQARLKERGMGLEQAYDQARHDLEAARRRLESARERAARIAAALGGEATAPLESHPRYRAALAARDAARIDLARTRVRAPAAGVVANLRLQPGERVSADAAVFTLIEDSAVWVEANFKETQLTHLREGQSATVVADAYPDREWAARVATISPATGAEFALLPPQNASGNWVKVVQRVPVRLRLDATEGADPTLRAGMTVTVRVDTGRERSLAATLRLR
ncbi:MAG TPA: HlyD family secretion protein [Burkholderiales bacterium]